MFIIKYIFHLKLFGYSKMIKKKLSVIVPVYNEEKTVITTLKKLQETKDGRVEYEIIVINDGSKDSTL